MRAKPIIAAMPQPSDALRIPRLIDQLPARNTSTRRFAKLSALIAMMMMAPAAQASTADAGYVGDTLVINGTAIFYHNGARTAVPGCAAQGTRFAFNASTPDGQAKLSLLLTAYALHKQITVTGNGSCGDWSDTETANFFIMKDS